MSSQCAYARSVSIGGKSFASKFTTNAQSVIVKEVSVPPASSGSLTVRTDGTTGTITITGVNTIPTGAKIDIYWIGGTHRGALVGTVAGQAVPISLGAGDALPTVNTPVTVCIQVAAVLQFVGDDVVALGLYTERHGIIDILTAVPASALAVGAFASGAAVMEDNSGFAWTADSGNPNPLAGATVASVTFSHDDTTAAHTMRLGVGLNY